MNHRTSDWFLASRDIRVGQRLRMPHSGCSIGDTLLVTKKREGVSAFCFLCKTSMFVPADALSFTETMEKLHEQHKADTSIERVRGLPSPANEDIPTWPLEARVWLYKGGLSNDDITQCGIFYHEPSERVVVPIRDRGKLVYWQARHPNPGKGVAKYLNPAMADRSKLVAVLGGPGGDVVLTEDFLSAYRVYKATGVSAVALLGTSISSPVLARLLSEYERIAVWLDADAAGRQAAAAIARKLALYRATHADICTELDPKRYSTKELKDVIRRALTAVDTPQVAI